MYRDFILMTNYQSSVSQAVLEPFRSLQTDTALRDPVSPVFSTLYGKRAACNVKASSIDKSEKKVCIPMPKWQRRKSIRAAVGDVSEAVLPQTLPTLELCEVKSNILIPLRSRSASLVSKMIAMSDDI
jgi:hypothetical protein